MEKFLNSENFCKMAKEYNEKYNKIKSLNVDEKEDIKNLIFEIEKICNILKKSFYRNARFSVVLDKICKLEKDFDDIKRDLDINEKEQNSIRFYSYKRFFLDAIKVFNGLFLLEKNKKDDRVEIIQKDFFDVISTFLANF